MVKFICAYLGVLLVLNHYDLVSGRGFRLYPHDKERVLNFLNHCRADEDPYRQKIVSNILGTLKLNQNSQKAHLSPLENNSYRPTDRTFYQRIRRCVVLFLFLGMGWDIQSRKRGRFGSQLRYDRIKHWVMGMDHNIEIFRSSEIFPQN